MTDLDLDSIDPRKATPGQVADVIAALREARAEVEHLHAEAMPRFESWMADDNDRLRRERNEYLAERDDWRRRYEALRDGVTEAVEGSLYVGTSLAATIRAVVARVERVGAAKGIDIHRDFGVSES